MSNDKKKNLKDRKITIKGIRASFEEKL